MSFKILSPVTVGSGVEVIHGLLAGQIGGYRLQRINPWHALAAPSLVAPGGDWDLVHSIADLGAYGVPSGVPLVITFHSFSLDAAGLRHATWAQRLFYSRLLHGYVRRAVHRAQAVTAVSPCVADLVGEHFGIDVEVIANGVDIERFAPAPREPDDARLRVLFAGNLSTHKGKQVLVELARELADCCQFIVASGLRGGRLQDTQGIKLLGSVNHADMPAVYRDADVLLLPTRREGMSLVTLEAMASSLAVLTSDVPAQTLLVENGKGGFTVPSGDVRQYAEKLRILAASPALRESMGVFNRDRVVHSYGQEKMLANYRGLFERVASS